MVAVQPDTPSEPTGTPPSLPKAIAPGGGISRQPCNTTTIQIGFNYRLPYPFIVENSIAAAQIFAFIPAAIAYGLDIPEDKVVVRMLVPYDTTKELGYITTLAICFIAIDLVDRLALDLQTPHSKLFQNPLSSVSSLVDLIDISFPILAEEHLVSSPSRDQAEAGSQLPPGTVLEVQNPDPRFLNVIVFSTVVAILIYTATMVAVSRRYWAQKSRWRVPLSFETIKQEQRQSGQLTAKPEAHQETSWINK
ncbi:MAG: hypothetical protein M1840_001027 [Geoglossum simile]|nr:MAG: hypothetical protein M1840_001027 [Geoglossum simile]